MARIVATLTASFTPAFYALIALAEETKATHGEEFASEWANRTLRADFDLFCRIGTEVRPALRLINGGLA